MTATPRIRSIQVGQPRTVGREDSEDPQERAWTTAFFKEPVSGRVRVGTLGIRGDTQADAKAHGGPDKAVLAYGAENYARWREELGVEELVPGGFGENLTVEGLDESGVCLGDVWSAGSALLQVTQPRGPCWKIARRWGIPDLTARVGTAGRTGWYLRVLREGDVGAGDAMTLVERPCAEWSVARANAVIHGTPRDVDATRALAACAHLAPATRRTLERRLAAS